jgi:hypothetical protein
METLTRRPSKEQPMGTLKQDLEEDQQRWAVLVQERNLRCERCAARVGYDEREGYFESGFCATCRGAAAK